MVRCSTIADIKYEEFKEEDGNSDDDDVFYDAMDEDIPQILVELNILQEKLKKEFSKELDHDFAILRFGLKKEIADQGEREEIERSIKEEQ